MKKITAFGEVLFDIYSNSRNLGGAPLNFIYHINKLTGQGRIISRVGNDLFGREVLEFLNSQGLAANTIQTDAKNLTGAALVLLDENRVPSFTIEEDRAFDFITLDDDVVNLVENETACLYFGTLAQRNSVSRNTLRSLFNKNIKYFCDLNIRQKFYSEEILFQSLMHADAVKMNYDELELISKIFLPEEFNLLRTSKRLMRKFNIDILAITKGADGSVLFKGEDIDEYKAEVQNVIDTVGAGDAFASLFCIGYLNNWDMKRINELANEFAAEICTIYGALPKDDKIYERYKREIRK